MPRSNRRFESWDDGPPGAETEPDRLSERSPRIPRAKYSRMDERLDRAKHSDSSRSPESHSKRNINSYDKNVRRGRSCDLDYDNRKNRSCSRSTSSDSDRRKGSSRHDDLMAGRSHWSSSRDKKKGKILKSTMRNVSSSSSKSSTSSSSSSKSSSSDSSDDSSESCSSSQSDSLPSSTSRNRRPIGEKQHSMQRRLDPLPESHKDITPVPFKNDGSFLEMFKKMQESKTNPESESSSAGMGDPVQPPKKPVLPLIMKRRGGRLLKTGLVKKAKAIDEQHVDNTPKDAWSLYMQEVKKYRDTTCEEEGKTRPLVK